MSESGFLCLLFTVQHNVMTYVQHTANAQHMADKHADESQMTEDPDILHMAKNPDVQVEQMAENIAKFRLQNGDPADVPQIDENPANVQQLVEASPDVPHVNEYVAVRLESGSGKHCRWQIYFAKARSFLQSYSETCLDKQPIPL